MLNAVGLKPGVPTALILVFGLLAIGSVFRFIALRGTEASQRRTRLGSLAVWWIGLTLVSLIGFGGTGVAVIVFAIGSWIGLSEYFRLLDRMGIDATGRFVAYLAVPFTYAPVWLNYDLWFAISVPAVTFLLFAACLIAAEKTTGYLAAVASLIWGTTLIVFLLAHAAKILAIPETSNPVAGSAGWFIYLIVLTECDDIFQALWGRRFGRRKITPRISPNKTLEGLLGGVLSTLVIGVFLAPCLTPLAEPWTIRWSGTSWKLPYLGAVASSMLISLVGFFGDLNMSALKRDAGVKDTGTLLPGQGGILDRIDSLTFTAPVFYYFIRLIYG